jgi:mannose-1-phosphate guanylyltransferase/mannose-6-phosphate isomerase
LAPPARIWVVAPRALARDVRRELPELRRDRFIAEPSPRDTAPAIALACAHIARCDPRAIALILPSDHLIADTRAFGRAVVAAGRAAEAGSLVCIGIAPSRPATGFGYLKVKSKPKAGVPASVEAFVEKPDAARARRFVRSGRYLWNGGMFAWRVDRFAEELARVAPKIHEATAATAGGNAAAWQSAPKISVDYAVMEKAADVAVVALDAGWDDVGSWDAAARHASSGARGEGSRVILGSEGTAVFGGRRLVVVVDVPGVVVVDTEDALLVVARASSEKLKSVVEAVRAAGRADVL